MIPASLVAALLLAINVTWNFEGGNLGKVDHVTASPGLRPGPALRDRAGAAWGAETHFRCAVKGQSDQDGRNRQANWYYFRLDGARGKEVIIDLVDLVGEYNYRPGSHAVTRNTRPVYSYDGKSWVHFENVQWDEAASPGPRPGKARGAGPSLRLRFTPAKDRMWIAHMPPYTTRDLAALVKAGQRHAAFRSEVIGKSVQGRPLYLMTITNPHVGASDKQVLWLMARQHAWEAGTSWMIDGAIRYLLSSDPEAALLRDRFIVRVFPMADPDGVVNGAVRYNANGYDLNRNWDSFDPKLVPEIAAYRGALFAWQDSGGRIDLFLALHNQENNDLMEGPSAAVPHLQETAGLLQKYLDETGQFLFLRQPRDSGATTTPGMKGRATVYQALANERKIPALLLETSVETIPSLGRPRTVHDWQQLGVTLLHAATEAVTSQ